MAKEHDLIRRIARALGSRAPANRLRLGIGDDAAVVRPERSSELVLTCDWFLEGVHFLPGVHPPSVVGYKSLARAVSDLAAMGAIPTYFLLSLALPRKAIPKRWLDRFLAGLAHAADKFGMHLIGGDTTRNATLAINVTALGEMRGTPPLTRSGARTGDLIFVSGMLGSAQLGLDLIQRGLHRKPRWKHLLEPHLFPEPRLALGRWLAGHRAATAAIDTSDGLSTDLAHICEASRVGAVVEARRLPTFHVPDTLRRGGINPLALALHGGEDYELLFTVPLRRVRALPASFNGVPLTCIGRITRQRGTQLLKPSGRSVPLLPRGWDPFRAR
jgi:thiamine-monophosphate kinase